MPGIRDLCLLMPNATGHDSDLPLQSVVDGIVWPAILHKGVPGLRNILAQLNDSQWLSEEVLRAHQMAQLKSLLRHSIATVPHYASAFAGVDLDGLNFETFAMLPRLGRRDFQENFAALKSTALPISHGQPVEGQSSGSTGMPVRFLRPPANQLYWLALTVREHLWHARDFTGKLCAIRVRVDETQLPNWGMPVTALFRTGPASTLDVRTDLSRQLDWLIREDPDYLLTHASNLHALAKLSITRGVRLPRLRQARSFSEALHPELRGTVRAAWGVETVDVYSCEEAGYIALQCPHHEHYHVQAENIIVEVLDDNGRRCEVGETGEIVLTTLHNFATPLVRYRLGDFAEVGAPCTCGRGLPVLRRIHGRQRNMLTLPDGRRHWPSFPSSLWLDVAPVEQFQVIQRNAGSLEINYVMQRTLTASEQAQLSAALIDRLGFAFNFDWRRRDGLERSKSGKFEDFMSLVDAADSPTTL